MGSGRLNRQPSQELLQVAFTGTGFQAADPAADSGGAILAQQVQGDAPQDGKVLRRVLDPRPARVFIEGDVQRLVHAFDRPVGTHCTRDASGVRAQA